MVVQYLPIDAAVNILEETDHLTYRRHTRLLRSDRGEAFQVILSHSHDQRSMILYRDSSGVDRAEAYLVGQDVECMGEAIMALPAPDTSLSMLLTQRERAFVLDLQPFVRLRDAVTRYDFHCTVDTLLYPASTARIDVVRFRPHHKDLLVTANIDEGGFAHWLCRQWDQYFLSEQPVFGVIAEGRVASFCAMALDGEVSMIYTFPEYQNRGFAKQSLYVATKHMLGEGVMGYYNVEAHNEASIATARSVGYVQHAELTNYRSVARELGPG